MPWPFLEDAQASNQRQLIIVGGTHGAGKSTFCRELRQILDWPWLAPEEVFRTHPDTKTLDEAHRFLREHVRQSLADRTPFLFEHVMSGRFVAKLIRLGREADFRIHLIYLDVADAQVAEDRVTKRARADGRVRPFADIARRMEESRRQFWRDYAPAADTWTLYDNTFNERQELAHSSEESGLVRTLPPEFDTFLNRL